MIPSYRDRFAEALESLCGDRPPDVYVDRWLAGDESAYDHPRFEQGEFDALTLQDWAATHAPRPWMMGIAVLDAAHDLARQPIEQGILETTQR